MKLSKNITIFDVSLYLEDINMLIITDIHLGQEESLHRKGFLIPPHQYTETKKKMESILAKVKPKKILINGDLKHEFGSIIGSEWKNTLNFIDYLQEHCEELILIKGNHDVILEPIARKKNIKLIEYYAEKEYFICHGDKIFDTEEFKKSKIVIIGNEHPAISLTKSGRREMYKCFLIGKYDGKQLIVVPSFNVLTIGSDVLHEKRLSPYVPEDVSKFKVYIIEDDVYDFGTVKDVDKL